MKYLKFIEKKTSNAEEKESFLINLLRKILEFLLPQANPDFDHLYLLVETWYIEYDEIDEQDGAYREVGRDAYGRIIVKDPDERNSGFWSDTNMGINDYIKQMHAEYISKEEFEAVWNEELVRADKKSYR